MNVLLFGASGYAGHAAALALRQVVTALPRTVNAGVWQVPE